MKHYKHLISLFLILILIATSCQSGASNDPDTNQSQTTQSVETVIHSELDPDIQEQIFLTQDQPMPSDEDLPRIEYGENLEAYEVTWYEYFDTVSTVMAFVNDQAEFESLVNYLEQRLAKWHQILNNFEAYENITNIYNLNETNGEWVKLDSELIELLIFSKDMYEKTNGQVNIAIGAVTDLWHLEREKAIENSDFQGELPDQDKLEELGKHAEIENLEIDKEQQRARITNPNTKIDLGAVAKGYVSQVLKEELIKKGYSHVLMNFGGNIVTIGEKPDGEAWRLGIRQINIDSTENEIQFAEILEINNLSLITSGDYERYYNVGENSYHHILDPETLFPSTLYTQVSIVSENAAWGDTLSTALFNVSIEEGEEILKNFPNTSAYWITKDNQNIKSSNFDSLLN
mgnify:CR=1 FL=1